MGKISRIWRKVKKGTKKAIKPVISTVAGATIGFLIGGPPGALAGAITSLAASLDHGGGLAVAANNIPINTPPAPTSRIPSHASQAPQAPNTTPDPSPNPSKNDEIALPIIIDAISAPIESMLNTSKIAENLSEKSEKHPKFLVWLGKVFETGIELKDKYDELLSGPSGPRYEILKTDSQMMQSLKIRANNILDDVEANVGEEPGSDITRGLILKHTVEKIKELEKDRKICCPSCGGARTQRILCACNAAKDCGICHGKGFRMDTCMHCLGSGYVCM